MRLPLETVARARARRAVSDSAPAPVRGWNARDSIAAMHPADAVVLDNVFPRASDVMVRLGSVEHATGIGSAEVETLAVYRPESGQQKLFAFSTSGDLYDVSSSGPVGSPVLSGLTSARWQCVNFSNSSGNFLLCVNGADEMRLYDGSQWKTINGGSTPAITGVNTDQLVGVFVFKQRPWYIQRNSLSLWYPAVGAFAGALSQFPLQGVFKKGGFILAGGSWTRDAGDGMDDLMVVVTSEGEAAVYQGTDPSDPSAFALVGVYEIGTPIGRRCLAKLGGDLLIITTDGVIPSSRLPRARDDRTAAITDYIQTAMAEAVARYGSQFGWEAVFFPAGNMLLLNVPVASGLQEQFVMNTITRRWCRFRPLGANPGWPAWCFEVFNGQLYFGTRGEVRRAWVGANDVGAPIESEIVTAFNYFGRRSFKHFTMVRPILGWDSNPANIRLGIDVEFITGSPSSEVMLPESVGAQWDDGLWDVGLWGGEVQLQKDWYSVEGGGFAAALHLAITSSQANVQMKSWDVVFEPGEIL